MSHGLILLSEKIVLQCLILCLYKVAEGDVLSLVVVIP